MQLDKKLIYFAAVVTGLSLCGGCSNVEQIVERQLDDVIEWELNKGAKNANRNSVLVALYLDTVDSKDATTIAEYRCYNYGSKSYSGIQKVPFGTPWTRWEKT